MLVNRVISNSHALISRKVLMSREPGRGFHSKHVIFTPPKTKVSTTEKVIVGISLALSLLAVPAWILYYIPDYQQQDRHKYRGN